MTCNVENEALARWTKVIEGLTAYNRVHLGHINPSFNDGRADQNVRFSFGERVDPSLKVFAFPVSNDHSPIWKQVLDPKRDVLDLRNMSNHVKHL